MPPLPGPAEGVAGPAGGPGAAGPRPLPARKRPVQSDHHVRAGVVSQHAEEAGAAGRCGLQRRRQLQHTVPQTGVRRGQLEKEAHRTTRLSDRDSCPPGRSFPRSLEDGYDLGSVYWKDWEFKHWYTFLLL